MSQSREKRVGEGEIRTERKGLTDQDRGMKREKLEE